MVISVYSAYVNHIQTVPGTQPVLSNVGRMP